MQLIFLNLDGKFEDVCTKVSGALGLSEFAEGDSSNVSHGLYYSYSVFGLSLKLESNSYDYEDSYSYMLSLKKDILSKINSDDQIIEMGSVIVAKLLAINLRVSVARETPTGLEIIQPS